LIPLKDDTPVETFPAVTIALIAACVLAFLWQLSVDGPGQIGSYSALVGGAIPYEILSLQDVYPRDIVPPPFTILTSMFLHGGLLHIGSNMLFLWIFGNNVEDALGKGRFILFYVACGIVAGVVQVLASAVSAYSNGTSLPLDAPMVGASGAIAGVLAGYLVLFPRARVLTLVVVIIFVQLVRVPARFFIGAWFVLQVLAAIFGGSPGVAVFAHIGGFVAGYLLVRILGRRPGWRARRVAW
jgi:membrane associated rhomboid family serine protease